MGSSKEIVEKMFAGGGIAINGANPWDIQVHNLKFYDRFLSQGSIGFGEAYMEGWWDSADLGDFLFRMLYHRVDKLIPKNFNTIKYVLKARFTNRQDKSRASEVAYKHYDIGNDLYKLMLDERMIYSCAVWNNAQTLDEAQDGKLDLICRKLKLEKGMRLLDIGCGWGGLARYAAENFGVSVVGITLSKEQAAIATEVTKHLPVEIRIQDYRDVNEKFDRIVSVEMLEAVGYRNFRIYMETVAKNLVDDGIFVLQTIGGTYAAKITDPWIDKYIFPNGMLPSLGQLSVATQGLFVMEDLQTFSTDYDRTCTEWCNRFEEIYSQISDKYNETFRRMWRFYLTASAASFRARKNFLWQIAYTKPKNLATYKPVR